MTGVSLEKNERVLEAGFRSLEILRAAGVKIGFGSDLLGQLQNDHCNEFLIRAKVLSSPEIIRSATIINAEIFRQEGRLGEIVPGAHADLLVVDGDPYRDLSLFRNDGARTRRDYGLRTLHKKRAVRAGSFARRATIIPASTITPPIAWRMPNASPSQTQPNIAAVSGSIKITSAEKDAGRWPSA